MNTEYEARILEIDSQEFIKKLEKLGAKKVNDYYQKRYVYDFKPVVNNKWIRLRTDGVKATLTIKKIENDNIDGTKELEIEVSDFEKTNLILNELGYQRRAYQENKRTRYIYNNIEIDIDSWPMIPTYVELEGNGEQEIKDFIKLIGYEEKEIVTYGVSKIYKHYGIDIDAYEDLKF